LQPLVEGHAHARVHLVLQEDEVPHDHHVAARPLEGRPRSQAQGWRHSDTGCGHGEIGSRDGHLEDALLLIESALRARERLDPIRVEAGRRRRLRANVNSDESEPGGENDHCAHDFTSFYWTFMWHGLSRAGERREHDPERAPSPLLAVELDPPAVGLDGPKGDRESETRTAPLARPRRVDTVETIEDAGAVAFRDTGP